MDFTALKAKLNTRLGDADNFAFTSEEKDEILTEAIQDPYVVRTVWDETLTFASGTYQYEIPEEISTVKDVYIKRNAGLEPEPITVPYEVIIIDDLKYLQFKGGSYHLPHNTTLYIRGSYKLTITDNIDDVRTQQYVLNLAQLNALDNLGMKKVLRFLKNDVSVSEIVTIKRELERKVAQHRASIQREYQAA